MARALFNLLTVACLVALRSTEPLKTMTSKVMTIEGPSESNGVMMINVLRTDDLIADRIPSKPLLLEKISHLLIRVEISPSKCLINGHDLPLISSDSNRLIKEGKIKQDIDPKTGETKLKMSVEMSQVQTLKLPKDSPLIPLGLSPPELLKISDKYIAEGVVGAILSMSKTPLDVEATTLDGQKLEAEAFKVTIGIQIVEIDGVILSTTDLPSTDLLELIVHPDPKDPTKVLAITTVAPEQLSETIEPEPIVESEPSSSSSLLDSMVKTGESGLLSALNMFENVMKKISNGHDDLPVKPHHRKPCGMGRHVVHDQPIPYGYVHDDDHNVKPTVSETLEHSNSDHRSQPPSVEEAKNLSQSVAEPTPEYTNVPKHHKGINVGCMLMMFWKHSSLLFKVGLPALLLLSLFFAIGQLATRIRDKRQKSMVRLDDESVTKALLEHSADDDHQSLEEKVNVDQVVRGDDDVKEVVVVISSPPAST